MHCSDISSCKAEIWAQRLENNQSALLKIADIADPQEQPEAARAIGEAKAHGPQASFRRSSPTTKSRSSAQGDWRQTDRV